MTTTARARRITTTRSTTMSDYPTWVIFNSTQYCVAPGCTERREEVGEIHDEPMPRRAVPGTDLCEWHHARFPKILRDLVSLLGTLATSVTRTPAGANDRVQTSDISDVTALWNPAVSVVLAEIDDWTAYLVRTITRDRPIPEGHVLGLTADTPTRQALAGIARWHARWLTGYPTLGPSLLDDAATLRASGMRALEAPLVRRVHLSGEQASCRHVIEEIAVDGGTAEILCGAPLVGVLRDPTDRRVSAVVCSANPAHEQIARTDWMRLQPARAPRHRKAGEVDK